MEIAIAVMTAEGALLTALTAFVGVLFKRQADLESSYDRLFHAREGDAVKKRLLGDHIDVLEDHIWKDKGPPPPPRPVPPFPAAPPAPPSPALPPAPPTPPVAAPP